MRRLSSSLKWVLGSLIAALLLAGGSIGLLLYRASGVMEEDRRRASMVLDAIPEAESHRPAIFDPPEPGNAWELEVKVLEDLVNFQTPREEIYPRDRYLRTLRLKDSVPMDPPEEFKDERNQMDPHWETVREALRRTSVVPACRPGYFAWSQAQALQRLMNAWTYRLHREGRDGAAVDHLVLTMGLAQDVARLGDLDHLQSLLSTETAAVFAAKKILSDHRLSSGELESFARGLDRLAAARPSVTAIVQVDGIRSQRFVIDDFENAAVSASSPYDEPKPTWRDLWTRRLQRLRRERALGRAVRAVEGLDAVPSWKRQEEASKRLAAVDASESELYNTPNEFIYKSDAVALLHLAMLRVGVALAWHEVERGAFPAALQDLVPRYLPAVPLCPYSGRPLRYESGRVWSDGHLLKKPGDEFVLEFDPSDVDWTVRRKP